MGTIHALQRRVEVAQQGLALFDEEARSAGARLTDAFGRIEDVLREKDFQLVRRELEVQRLTRENAQARMLLETLLETVEQRKATSLREVIEEFERKLAASVARTGDGAPPADSMPEPPAGEAGEAEESETKPAEAADQAEQPEGMSLAELLAEAARPAAAPAAPATPPPAPLAAFADPAGDATVTVAAAQPEPAPAAAAEDAEEPRQPEAEILPPAPAAHLDPNDELIADARNQLRSRKGGARLLDEEQRRYAYKVWLGPILIGVGALGPLALVLARISH